MREDRRRRYDDGFRREALELIKAGAGGNTLARRLAIPVYTARNWIRLYRSGGEEAVMGGNDFDARGVQFRSLTESIDTSTPGGTLIFNIFGSLAQFERDLIRERTRAGLEAARARGRTGGRPVSLDEKQIKEVRRLYKSRSVTVGQIASMMRVSRTTIYRCLQKNKGTN